MPPLKFLKKFLKNIDVVQLGTLTYLGPDLSKIRTQISGLLSPQLALGLQKSLVQKGEWSNHIAGKKKN